MTLDEKSVVIKIKITQVITVQPKENINRGNNGNNEVIMSETDVITGSFSTRFPSGQTMELLCQAPF